MYIYQNGIKRWVYDDQLIIDMTVNLNKFWYSISCGILQGISTLPVDTWKLQSKLVAAYIMICILCALPILNEDIWVESGIFKNVL